MLNIAPEPLPTGRSLIGWDLFLAASWPADLVFGFHWQQGIMIPLLQPGVLQPPWPACVCSNNFERIGSRKSDLLFKEVLFLQGNWFLHNKEAWDSNNPLNCSFQWRLYTSTPWNYDQKWFCDWTFGMLRLLLSPVYTKCLCATGMIDSHQKEVT